MLYLIWTPQPDTWLSLLNILEISQFPVMSFVKHYSITTVKSDPLWYLIIHWTLSCSKLIKCLSVVVRAVSGNSSIVVFPAPHPHSHHLLDGKSPLEKKAHPAYKFLLLAATISFLFFFFFNVSEVHCKDELTLQKWNPQFFAVSQAEMLFHINKLEQKQLSNVLTLQEAECQMRMSNWEKVLP